MSILSALCLLSLSLSLSLSVLLKELRPLSVTFQLQYSYFLNKFDLELYCGYIAVSSSELKYLKERGAKYLYFG